MEHNNLKIVTEQKCDTCKSRGLVENAYGRWQTCARCEGTGSLQVAIPLSDLKKLLE